MKLFNNTHFYPNISEKPFFVLSGLVAQLRLTDLLMEPVVGGVLALRVFSRGGRKRLPKFKFSAKFPIGLHVILQIQIKKFENDYYIM